jgi:hypothetical protein
MDVVAQLYERSRNAAQRRTILNIFGILLNGFFRFVSAAGGGGRDGVRRFTPVGSSSGERAAEQELSERAELWRMADAVREQNAQREEARKEEAAEREERTAQRTAEGQLRERQLALQERGVAAQEAHSLSARQEAEEMLRRRTAMRDASSVESQSVRDGFMREIEIMQGLGWRAPRAIMQALPTMSGEQIESIREGGAMQSAYRRYGIRGRGGVGGGASGGGRGASPAPGAVAREQWGTANDPLVGAATSAGVPDVVARSMAGDAGERARLTRSLATGSLTQGRQEAGRLDADTRNLGRDLDDQRRITNAAERANQLFRGASDAELRAAFMGGALGDLAPERIQQLRSAANELQAETLRERSGATVSDPEFERTRRELGTMPTTSPSVSRGWVTRAVRHYRDMRGRIRARYGDDVVSAYDQRLRREGVDAGSARGNAGAPAQPTRARRVNVRNAQGEVRSVPESQLDRARAAGWEPVTRGR